MLAKISTRISLIVLALSLVPVSVNSMESVHEGNRTFVSYFGAGLNPIVKAVCKSKIFSLLNPIQENRINALCKVVRENPWKFLFASYAILLSYKYWTPLTDYAASFSPCPSDGIVNYNIFRDYGSVKKIFTDNEHTLVDGYCNDAFMSKLFFYKESNNVNGAHTAIKIIKKNNQVAGVMTFVRFDRNTAMVELLAVDEKYRRLGFGYQLLTEAQTMAQKKKFENLNLYVSKTNDPAIKLYEKFGFKNTGDYNDNLAIM